MHRNPPGALTIAALARQLKEAVMREHDTTEVGSGAEAVEGQPAAHDSGLLLIGVFKVLKSLFFFCLGIGVFHLMNKDLSDEVMHVATALRFDTDGRFVSFLLEKVSLIDVHRLRQIGLFDFGYSVIALIEGYGLVTEKVWAEYLTLILTICFMPYEIYELVRKPSWLWFCLLLINLGVLLYLVWLLQRKRRSPPSRVRAILTIGSVIPTILARDAQVTSLDFRF